MRRAAPVAIAALIALAIAGGRPSPAAAYPHYQLASGTDRCGDCHHAPAGGGLLTEWGRGELGETLSRGGNGAFLYGVPLPAWLDLGGDVRLAALGESAGADGVRTAVFPMQLEVAARVGSAAASATVVVGARAAARTASDRPDDDAGGFSGLAAISREHFVSYQSDAGYVRAGRFAAPFGLRLPDHTAFVRRYLGYGLYEETYGVSAGKTGGSSELHGTLFVGDPIQWNPGFRAGAALLAERRWGPRALLGSARVTWSADAPIAVAGVAGKWWLPGPRVLIMGELDGGWQALAGAGRPLAAAWLGPTWFATRGVHVTAAVEAFAPDVRVPATGRIALSPSVSVLPWAHVEVAASARFQQVGAGGRAAQAMVQLHLLL